MDAASSSRESQMYIVTGVCIAFITYMLVTSWLPWLIAQFNLAREKRRVLVSIGSETKSIDTIKSELKQYKHESTSKSEQPVPRKLVRPMFTFPSRPTSDNSSPDGAQDSNHNQAQSAHEPVKTARPTFSLEKRRTSDSAQRDANKDLIEVDEASVPMPQKNKTKKISVNSNRGGNTSSLTPNLSSFREGSIEAQLHEQLNNRVGTTDLWRASRVSESTMIAVEQERALRSQQDAEFHESVQRDAAIIAKAETAKKFSQRVADRRAHLAASILPEPDLESSPCVDTDDATQHKEEEEKKISTCQKVRKTVTLQFRFRNSTSTNNKGTPVNSSNRIVRRFCTATATTGDVLNYVESLEMHPLLCGEPILTLDFPTRVFSRGTGDCTSLLQDAGINSDSVVWVSFAED